MRAVAAVLVLAALLGAGGLVALAASAPSQAPVAAGAVATADLAVPDPDLVPVVGLARGPSLFGLPLGAAPSRVLAVPEDAPADADLGALRPTGRTFDFTDPNGNTWSVAEYEAPWGTAYGTATGPVTVDPAAGAYNFVLLVDGSKVGGAVRLVAA